MREEATDKQVEGSREKTADILISSIGIQGLGRTLSDVGISLHEVIKIFERAFVEIDVAVDYQMVLFVRPSYCLVMTSAVTDVILVIVDYRYRGHELARIQALQALVQFFLRSLIFYY